MRNRRLHDAVERGDFAEMEALLQQDEDVNAPGPYRWTPLLTAAHKGQAEMVRWLLTSGADTEVRDREGKNALHHAAMLGQTEVVRLLLEWGLSADSRDDYGYSTPLHLTAAHAPREADRDTAAALLDAGAQQDSRDRWGKTPLMIAAFAGRVALLHDLLDHGAGIDTCAQDGTTALMLVARWGFRSEEVTRTLLQRGASPEMRDTEGRTALMHAAAEANTKLLRMLLESGGGTVNLQDAEGKTALHHAAGPAPRASVIGMLNRTPECREANARLLEGAWRGRAEAVRLLMEARADPTIRDAYGRTAREEALRLTGNEAVRRILASR